MNHQIPQYNQNIPILNHTDWATMAKQWATLRANVNIPTSINKVENYTYQHIPPPPPPPPSLSAPKPALIPYSNEYKPVVNHDPRFQFNRNTQNLHINNNIYEPPMHSMYNEIMPSNNNSHCETFDYNHRDRPFVNFNNNPTFNRPSSFSQNAFNLPPPTHQDYIEPQPMKPTFLQEPVPPKLFPIDVKSQPLLSTPAMPMKEQPLPFIVNKFDHQSDFSTTRTTKGLPAWIIDDMKKIKEKEKKLPVASMGDYRDHHLVNSKRDEEGDIVMEDDNKEPEIDPILSGKSVITTNRIDNLSTEIDIDDVNLNDEDDGFDKIDYSSKSLIDLIEMLDENELDILKIVIIRDSLTGVMKEVTDDMITESVNTTFSNELSQINVKSRMKGVSRDSKTVNCISDATVISIDSPVMEFQNENTSHLLGLDAYESDDDVIEISVSTQETIDKISIVSETRDKWSTHKKSEAKVDKHSSRNKDNQKNESKEKKKSSSDTNSTRTSPSRNKQKSKSRDRSSRKRSKSRERHRSPDRRSSRSKDKSGSSHKKSKKHNSPDWREDKWKNDKCDYSSGRKRSRRDRSRS